jgi:hypothetical protein
MSTVFVGEAHPPKGDSGQLVHGARPAAGGQGRGLARRYRLQAEVADLTW